MQIRQKLFLVFMISCVLLDAQDNQDAQVEQSTYHSYLTLRNAGIVLGAGVLASLGALGWYHKNYFGAPTNLPTFISEDTSNKDLPAADDATQKSSDQFDQIVSNEKDTNPTITLAELVDQATKTDENSVEVATKIGGFMGAKSVITSLSHGVYGYVDAKKKFSDQHPNIDKHVFQKNPMWQAGKQVGKSGGGISQAAIAGLKAGGRFFVIPMIIATTLGLGTANLGVVEKTEKFPFIAINNFKAEKTWDTLHSQISQNFLTLQKES